MLVKASSDTLSKSIKMYTENPLLKISYKNPDTHIHTGVVEIYPLHVCFK